jgi:hypothetical protein
MEKLLVVMLGTLGFRHLKWRVKPRNFDIALYTLEGQINDSRGARKKLSRTGKVLLTKWVIC